MPQNYWDADFMRIRDFFRAKATTLLTLCLHFWNFVYISLKLSTFPYILLSFNLNIAFFCLHRITQFLLNFLSLFLAWSTIYSLSNVILFLQAFQTSLSRFFCDSVYVSSLGNLEREPQVALQHLFKLKNAKVLFEFARKNFWCNFNEGLDAYRQNTNKLPTLKRKSPKLLSLISYFS